MIKLMFLAIFAALVLLHVDVDGGLVKPEQAYDCYWKISNASDRVCRNHNRDGFFFLNVYTCSARCRSGSMERRLPPGITCEENGSGRPRPVLWNAWVKLVQNDDSPNYALACTPDVIK
uniref:Putative secreted protein n=1 Tax=Ixodes ricinus TaxID=34613 RepID=V5GJK5_IXORI